VDAGREQLRQLTIKKASSTNLIVRQTTTIPVLHEFKVWKNEVPKNLASKGSKLEARG